MNGGPGLARARRSQLAETGAGRNRRDFGGADEGVFVSGLSVARPLVDHFRRRSKGGANRIICSRAPSAAWRAREMGAQSERPPPPPSDLIRSVDGAAARASCQFPAAARDSRAADLLRSGAAEDGRPSEGKSRLRARTRNR